MSGRKRLAWLKRRKGRGSEGANEGSCRTNTELFSDLVRKAQYPSLSRRSDRARMDGLGGVEIEWQQHRDAVLE